MSRIVSSRLKVILEMRQMTRAPKAFRDLRAPNLGESGPKSVGLQTGWVFLGNGQLATCAAKRVIGVLVLELRRSVLHDHITMDCDERCRRD